MKISYFLRAAILTAVTLVPNLSFAQFTGQSRSADEGVNLPIQLTTDPAILFPPARDIRLTAGDVVSIHIYGATDYAPQDKVSLDGYIRLPLIEPVQVEGLTPHEAEHLIATRLDQAGMYNNPQVILNVVESPGHIVTVMGEIHGVVPVMNSKRLFDVIAAAGGWSGSASHVVTIDRPGNAQAIVVDLGNDPSTSQYSNVPVFAGDTVIVGRVGSVYITGAVKNQAAIPLTQNTPLSLMQAMATSGGLLYDAKQNDIKIVRTIGTKRSMITVHYSKVRKGSEPDPILMADDIVIVPNSAIKSAIRAGGIGTALAIASTIVFIATVNR